VSDAAEGRSTRAADGPVARGPASHGAPARRPRVSKRVLRSWAVVGSAVSFTVPLAALQAAPRPQTPTQASQRRVIEVHKITKRIIIHDPPDVPSGGGGGGGGVPQVRYVYTGGGGGGGGGGVHTSCSTC
jgi:hypothetical protein